MKRITTIIITIMISLILTINAYAGVLHNRSNEVINPAIAGNQTIGNTSLETIAGDTTSIDAKIPADMATETKQDSIILELQTLEVTDSEVGQSAFGEKLVAALTPQVQLSFNYNLNTDIVSTAVTGSGTATQANSKAVLQTTATTSSSASLESIHTIEYKSGQGAVSRFSGVFTACAANSTQLIGIGDATDGFFFGCNGASFGVMRRQNTSDTWVAQTSWSEDKAAGAETLPVIDWTMGQVMQIRFQWLGFGMISFWVENPATGFFVKVHQIEYANAYTDPSIFNPTLPLYAYVANTTNATNIMLQTSSMMGGIEGNASNAGVKNSISNTKSGITTETNVVTIQNKATFASKTNRVNVQLLFTGIAVDGTKNAVCRVIKNATLGGSPSYTDISVNTSVMSYDIAGTTITGGRPLFTFTLAKVDSKDLPLLDFDVEMIPGDLMTIGCASSANTEATASFSWSERF